VLIVNLIGYSAMAGAIGGGGLGGIFFPPGWGAAPGRRIFIPLVLIASCIRNPLRGPRAH